MDISTKITTMMMQRKIDPDTGGDLLDLALYVQRTMFCPCGVILDFHQASIVRSGPRVIAVYCPTCFDKRKADILKSGFNFVDGREYTKDFQKKAPPAKPKRAKPRANIRLGNTPNDLESVEYSKRFEGSGFTWFIHGKRGDWRVSNWACGFSLGSFDLQREGIERARSLTQEEIEIVKGSISLHGGANPPVKKGGR